MSETTIDLDTPNFKFVPSFKIDGVTYEGKRLDSMQVFNWQDRFESMSELTMRDLYATMGELLTDLSFGPDALEAIQKLPPKALLGVGRSFFTSHIVD
jgi:hypothetical protein